MKTKFTLLFTLLFIGFNSTFAQNNDECMSKLSLFHDNSKVKNYDAAYEPWMYLLNNCPKLNIIIYSEGEKILVAKIKLASGEKKIKLTNRLLELWKQRAKYFPNKTKKGQFSAKACQLKYDNKELLGKTDIELYDCFDETFKEDKTTFTNPKSLYTYYSLMVDLYDNGMKSVQDLFKKYEDITEKIEVEVKNYSEKLHVLIKKNETGSVLTTKEKKHKNYYENCLKLYDQITASMTGKSSIRLNCENLIPLYQKKFETHKSDSVWLKRAVNKMFHKGCTDVLLYENIVKAYDETAPSADTKHFVVTVLLKNSKYSEAENYLKQALNLETNTYKKGKLAYQIGILLKNRRKFSQARIYFNKALKLNPSNGKPHLSIASMYNASASYCGDSNFNQRAVYWLAVQEAKKASRIDPALKKSAGQSIANYIAKAPTREEIFIKGVAGKTIKIGCWIQSSIKVPNI